MAWRFEVLWVVYVMGVLAVYVRACVPPVCVVVMRVWEWMSVVRMKKTMVCCDFW
jgi:hypothetical protein